ncbi:MAG: site-2 protease family protein [Acidimicrobiia bacterium]|nr:site-2 protease family protein [Acidimicrobiia bacterium]
MTESIRLGRLLGIPIGVNWSIVAVAVLFSFALAVQALPRSAPDSSLGIRLTMASIAVVVFFASILAHELGHAMAAQAHGVGVHGITLWLLGGVAKLDRQAPSARAEFQIAVAGPAVSLALGVFFLSLTVILIAVAPIPLLVAVAAWLGGVNVILALFNLLPAAPLDGGRILTALLWRRSGDPEEARIIAGRCGLLLGAALVVIGVVQLLGLAQVGGWVTALVGAFSFTAARAEIAGAAVRRRLLGTTVLAVTVPHPPSVPDSVMVGQLLDWARDDGATIAHGVVRWGQKPIGYVVPADAAEGVTDAARSWTSVGQVMVASSAAARISGSSSVDGLLRVWERGSAPVAVVTGADGRSVGTVTDHQVRPLLTPPDLWGRDRPQAESSSSAAADGGTAPVSTRSMG